MNFWLIKKYFKKGDAFEERKIIFVTTKKRKKKDMKRNHVHQKLLTRREIKEME